MRERATQAIAEQARLAEGCGGRDCPGADYGVCRTCRDRMWSRAVAALVEIASATPTR